MIRKTQNTTLLFSTCLICMIMLFIRSTSNAASYKTLSTNDTWVSDTISKEGEVDYFQVTIPSAGWLTVTYQGLSVYSSHCEIWNNDLTTKYDNCYAGSSSDTSPVTKTLTVALEPGTYKVKIYGDYGNTGGYRVKASYNSANRTVSGASSFQTAKVLNFNQTVTGFISEDDRMDFYKITVPYGATIRLIYTSYIDDSSYIQIWNNNYIDVSENYVSGASESSPITYIYEEKLAAGTYYVKIYPWLSGCGRYTLKYEQKIMTSSIKISGNKQVAAGKSFQLSATVSPYNATNKTIQWNSNNTSIAGVDSKTGMVTTYRAGKVKITASATDGSNIKKNITVIVKPKKQTITSIYNSTYYRRTMFVKWNSQKGVTGYQIQYATNKKFKKAKSKKVKGSSYYKSISGLSKKAYYVRIRAYYKTGGKVYYGSWSNVKKVKIRR